MSKVYITDVEAGAVEPQVVPSGIKYLLTLPPPTHQLIGHDQPPAPIPERWRKTPDQHRADLLWEFREHVPVTRG